MARTGQQIGFTTTASNAIGEVGNTLVRVARSSDAFNRNGVYFGLTSSIDACTTKVDVCVDIDFTAICNTGVTIAISWIAVAEASFDAADTR